MSYDAQAQVLNAHRRFAAGREAARWVRALQSVFVVSGDEYVRQCLQNALSAQGMSPIVFETAAGYLACQKASAPACLILDVVLPDICGLDLQRRLAGTCPPIIFATRRAEIACSVRAIREGAFDFLTVPFESEELLRAVHGALDLDRLSRGEREEVNGLRVRFDSLTPREREVMPLITRGMQNKQIAWKLGISETTVQIHRGNIRRKMEVPSLADLVRAALRLGIEPVDTPLDLSAQGAARL